MQDAFDDDALAGQIAVIGMAGRFPGARTPGELWRLLREGREATEWPDEAALRAAGAGEAELTDPNYVRATLPLADMEMFDAGFFGFSKRDAAVLDPQHRHFLECCWEALEDAGHPPERFDGAVGVFGGCGMQAYMARHLLPNPRLMQSMGLFLLRHTGNDKDFLTTRVSYLLDLQGPSVGIQTACSTSLVAVHVAAQSLLSGECDMALAGGASIELPHRQGYRWAEGEILSPDGHCRAFDDEAGGTLFGSGAGVVVLRRLADALRDGDHVYAVIRGSAVNNDGSGKAGYLAPSVDGQARAAVEALAVAGVEPGTVSYVEAHGTGTPVGDPIEVAALSQAYGQAGPGALGLGSIKTNIGHLDTAAGVASLIKVCLALRHGLLPATLNFRRPNGRFDLARMPFRIQAEASPWPRGEAPRIAGVNSLGVGGTNAHVIVQEPPALANATAAGDAGWQLFTLSARTESSLKALRARWREFVAEPPPDFSLADAAYTTQVGRRAFTQRLALVARDLDGLRAALAGPVPGLPPMLPAQAGQQPPPVVFLFPGGGAHFPGAGRDLMQQPAFREAVQACLDALPPGAPEGLRELLFDSSPERPEDIARLEAPGRGIPALFILEYALGRLWASWGVQPAAMMGHSAGEYAAACLAGMLTLPEALKLVVLRAQLFEQAPRGGMLSVDLSEDALRPLAQQHGLDIAAVNAPDLCLVSGDNAALAQLQSQLVAQGVEARRLHIEVAAHSRLLDGVLEAFRAGLAGIVPRSPSVPILSSLTGEWITPGQTVDADYWVRHLRQPVQFAAGMRRLLAEMPEAALLEVGPGQGLGSLARHNGAPARQAVLASIRKPDQGQDDLPVMLASAGALWSRGLAVGFGALRGPGARRRTPLPTYAFDHERHWIDAPQQAPEQIEAPAPAQDAARPLTRLPELAQWFHATTWQPAAAPRAPAPEGRWLVLGAQTTQGRALLRALSAQGQPTIAVDCGTGWSRRGDSEHVIDPARAEDWQALLSHLERENQLPQRVVMLLAPNEPGDWPAARALAFDAPVQLARAWQQLDLAQPLDLVLATCGSQALAGERPRAPGQALALGPCRVIPRELPGWRARLVDLDPAASAEACAEQLQAEAAWPDAADLVAWRGGQRWLPQAEAAPGAQSGAPARLKPGGVYLITGGLGGVGLALAEFLARRWQAKLVLVGRRGMPPPERWPELAQRAEASAQGQVAARLLALQAAGTQLRCYSADVSDRARMAQVLDACRRELGALDGVFHAAGELDDAPLATKPQQAMHRLLAAKAEGALVLDALVPAGSVSLFAVFSSTSIELAPPGQVDYVAANALLESLALSRPDGLVMRWGVWADIGMAARAAGPELPWTPPQAGPHPLLGRRADAEGAIVFEALYDPRELWVLDEHRVAGRPVLPGTAYLEIAQAAMEVVDPGQPLEMQSLSFEQGMVFDQGPRQVQVRLRSQGAGHEFQVRSRGAGESEWTEHARASLRRCEAVIAPLPPAQGPWQPGRAPQSHNEVLRFGPRWDNLARMRLAQRSAVAELALPEAFRGELGRWGCHPAMVDMAATFGLHLLQAGEAAERLWVPVSVERVRLLGPLPAEFTSRVELRGRSEPGMACFDLRLHTGQGSPLATFEGFTLRAIEPTLLSLPRRGAGERGPVLAEAMREAGIRAQDAPAVFERLFALDARQLTISSLDLRALRQRLDASLAPVPRPAAPRTAAAAAAEAGADEAGLSPLEQGLAQVWRELLGVEQIGREDDFFALGGHSLVAVRLFARIRKQFGADLPLATLFEAPTLARLAAVVGQCLPQPVAEAAAEEAAEAPAPSAERPAVTSNVIPLGKRAWSPLVEICRGEAGRKPLFCVHGAGGNVLNFKLISDRVGTEQPFYGLQAQGVDGRLAPLQSVEAMASQYLEAIRSVLPKGPYRLAGYSAGGLIALEMAQQLRAQGEQVELLAMIDTLAPEAAKQPVPLWRKLWLLRHWSLGFALGWPERRRRGREIELRYTEALERMVRGEPLPPELVDFHLFRNFMAVQARYEPRQWAGEMVLFKARDSETQYLQAGPCLGWDRHITGPIRIEQVPGSHFSMMSEPGLSHLAAGIRAALAELDGECPAQVKPLPTGGTGRGWWRRLAGG